jgi:hypothetical protein
VTDVPGGENTATDRIAVPPTGAPPVVAPAVVAPADGTEAAETSETPERTKPTLLEQMGGPMGMVDSGLPVVVFVVLNAVAGLGWGIGAALAAGVIIAILRLVRRKPATQAIGGLFAVGVAAFIAWRTGSAKGYFLLGIWSYVVYGGVLLLSIAVRWPLVGVLWEGLNGRASTWRANRRLVRLYDWATLVWVAVFAIRFFVQHYLYNTDQVGWLATARLAMGYPMFALAAILTVLIVGNAAGMRLPWSKKPDEGQSSA